ncbi:MAG: ABC transporter permease [Anaerolineae bacterium]|nr:ABC transporter permease [Anaerolineae bacterium]
MNGTARRALAAVFTLWLAATLVFFALRLLPGDGLLTQLIESGASPATIAERRAALGLDQPAFIQYTHFLGSLITGDLGVSLLTGQPVAELIAQQLGATAELALASLSVAVAAGLALGTVAALGSRVIRRLADALLAFALSAPVYWTGTLAIFIFTARLGLLPSGGAGRLSQLVLPALVLGLQLAGGIGRVTQASFSETKIQPHVQTAHTKGLRSSTVLLRHIARPALPAIIGQIGIQAAFLLGGAVVTESIFSRPGIGRLLLDATLRQDYPIVQGIIIWAAAVVVIVNLLVDFAIALADPRVREGT